VPRSRSLGELALIDRIRSRSEAPARYVLQGIGDDCAVVRPPAGHSLLVTTDFSLENRHFRRDWHIPRSIGHRTLARGLSDLAAMGATPLAAFLSLALPRPLARDAKFLDGFLNGLLELAGLHHTPLAGGDTAESPSPELLADIVLLGSAPAGRELRRSTARPGDALYVTGELGGAAAELEALAAHPARFRRAAATDRHPHLFPAPRLAVGHRLMRQRLATACIDVSDGLSTDLTHLCQASNVAAELDQALLPIAAGATLQQALHGGEDYELLFTAAPTARLPRTIGGVAIHRIGSIVKLRRGQPLLTLQDGRRKTALTGQGWEHLQ
jgi:thiamine-monophosphate kinase